jgi:hypothetical protein
MDFIRKPEVLATANAVGTASIYFILSKRLNALTDEMDEIDTHLTSSIKKISENSRSLQGMTDTFKDVLVKFEDHRKVVSNISKMWKRLDEELLDMNDRYDALVSAVKDLGGNVDFRKLKKKKSKSSRSGYDSERPDRESRDSRSDRRRKHSDSDDDSSDSETERTERREKDREKEREKDRERKDKKQNKKDSKTQDYADNSDEDFTKKIQEAKKN